MSPRESLIHVLTLLAGSDTLVDQVILYMNYGMTDEWDCTLIQGLEHGFGGPELRIAASTALCFAEAGS